MKRFGEELKRVLEETLSPLQPLVAKLETSIYDIAPEREKGLRMLVEKLGIFATVKDYPAQDFEAYTAARGVWLGGPKLERYWAYCYAAMSVFSAWQQSGFKRKILLTDAEFDGPRKLLQWALGVDIGGKYTDWPADLPQPGTPFDQDPNIEAANKLFTLCMAFPILHEIGHIVKEHSSDEHTPSDVLVRHEFEADEWAYDYIMESWRLQGNDEKVYIRRSVAISVMFAIIAIFSLYSSKKVKKISHPNPIDRSLRFLLKHANESSGLPTLYAWAAASSVLTVHLSNVPEADVNKDYGTFLNFMVSIRELFQKELAPKEEAVAEPEPQ